MKFFNISLQIGNQTHNVKLIRAASPEEATCKAVMHLVNQIKVVDVEVSENLGDVQTKNYFKLADKAISKLKEAIENLKVESN